MITKTIRNPIIGIREVVPEFVCRERVPLIIFEYFRGVNSFTCFFLIYFKELNVCFEDEITFPGAFQLDDSVWSSRVQVHRHTAY